MPSHASRLSELTRLGVKVGMEGLTTAQAEKLTKILYSARDVMAESITQVLKARVPRHTIPIKDSKPVICKRFRYDPTKEHKLEAFCDDLLNAGIVTESSSLWNSPVFLTTKSDGSSHFFCRFPSLKRQERTAVLHTAQFGQKNGPGGR